MEFNMTEYEQVYGKNANGVEARDVYKNAENNKLRFCLMGKLGDIRSVASTNNEKERDDLIGNFGKTSGKTSGQVLQSENWSIGVNDAWVLGGIECGATFYFVKEGGVNSIDDIYIDTNNAEHPISVTAREIIGLQCFKYVPKAINEGKTKIIAFVPPRDIGNSNNISFKKYDNEVKNFLENNKTETVKQIINRYLWEVFK